MKKIFRKEVLIGLSVAIALVVLVVGIDFLKGVNVFKAANFYYASFTNVEGLAQSAPVKLNGFKVGQVRDISYEYENPGHVLVELSLNKELHLPKGTEAVLSTDLLGTAAIELKMASGTDFYEIGAHIPGIVPKGMMDNVTNNIMPAVSSILPKVDTLLSNINTLVSNPAIETSLKRMDAITANLEATSRQLAAMVGRFGPITADVKAITGNLSTTTTDMTAVTGKLATVPVDSIARNIQEITDNLRALTIQLNDPNSSLGMLTRDDGLYKNINSTVESLDSLFVDIKRNPKRYVTIKVF